MLDLKLNLPEACLYKQIMAKKDFYENADFNKREKDIFVSSIERITLYSQLTRDNTNIDIYKDDEKTYREISIILVELRKKDHMKAIAKLIMNAIPYPMILIGKYEEEYDFYGSHIKDKKLDSEKILLEKIYNTGFIDIYEKFTEEISYKNLNKVNFYKFYSDYIDAIINFNLGKRNITNAEDNKDLLEKIEKLEEEITSLKNKMKSEKQFNRKMDLNIKIKKLEEQLNAFTSHCK